MAPPVWTYAVSGTAAACAAVASLFAAPDLSGVLGAGLALVMIAIAVIDARRFVIPNELVLAGLLLGLIAAAVEQSDCWQRRCSTPWCVPVRSRWHPWLFGLPIGWSAVAKVLGLVMSSLRAWPGRGSAGWRSRWRSTSPPSRLSLSS